MSVVVVVGAQWGDEGKGKIVELLTERAGLLVHYAGGYNPGQSLMAGGDRLVFHLLPANAIRRGVSCLLAQGMAIDPVLLLEELEVLETHGAAKGELRIDQRAHLVLPHHIRLDELRAEVEGASGAPRRGIGPAYGDKVGRRGVQVGDLLVPERFESKVRASLDAAAPGLRALGGALPEAGPIIDRYLGCAEKLRARVVDGSRWVSDAIKSGQNVVLEAPFGTMIDLDQGSYPFVVTASTIAGGACTGTGIAPKSIDRVVGVAKAYATRSGPGPFALEVTGDLAAHLQRVGGELSPVTGRARRCGMFGVPELRYAARINGFDTLALTKLDVLTGLDEIPVCVGYELDGNIKDEPPFEGLSRAKPLLEMAPGWKESLRDCRSFQDLPPNARKYVELIESASGVRIGMVGVGPDRSETIVRDELPIG